MQVILAFAIVIGIALICSRIGDHNNIRQEGGIRKKYNLIFSFFYNLPNSKVSIETKSYVIFNVKDHRCSKIIRLNYQLDRLKIVCKITYFDDTPFNNGQTYSWEIWPNSSWSREDKVLQEIQQTFAGLP